MALTPQLQQYIHKDLGPHRVLESKQAELPFTSNSVSLWNPAAFPAISHDRLLREGYRLNAVVNLCVGELAMAYPQPRPVVKNEPDGDPIPRHPLQRLLDRPNPFMSRQDFAAFVMTYKAIGGVCYAHIVRNGSGVPIELWPYHIGQMLPVPGRFNWIDHYRFDPGGPDEVDIPAKDVIEFKWFLVDPTTPWLPLSPLVGVAREVDSDTEATRYMYALLKNDATPRTMVYLAQDPVTDTEKEHVRQLFDRLFSGDNRGRPAWLGPGSKIERLALNMEEIAFQAIRRVPEDRICSAFKVPAEIVGVTAGKEQSTYNNVSEAREGFFADTIAQLCDRDADSWTHKLGAEFGDVVVEYDYSKVKALQENEDARSVRVVSQWEANLLKLNEARTALGYEEVGMGDVFKDGSDGETEPAPPPQVTVEEEIDTIEGTARLLEDQLKSLQTKAAKAKRIGPKDAERLLRAAQRRAVTLADRATGGE